MDQLNRELLKLLALGKTNQKSIMKKLDDVVRAHGTLNLKKWRNSSNKKNSFLHELVENDMPEVVRYVIEKFELDINVRRISDGLTALQLAKENHNQSMCDLLIDLGAADMQTEYTSERLSDEDKLRAMNIVWIDLEMTALENGEIMECAVIITNKNLQVLEKKNWVIHFDQSVLDGLGDWHKQTFADKGQNGNGLFADVLKSKLRKEQAEGELLALIQRHCPPKLCPLAGSSIHIDKDVLKREMPKVHDYLHYRIIDTSSFQAVFRRWAPWIEGDIKKQLNKTSQGIVNHRAMDDIEWSLAFMREFRLWLIGIRELKKQHKRENQSPVRRHLRRSASPSTDKRNDRFRNDSQINTRNTSSFQLYNDEKRLVERLKDNKRIDISSLQLSQSDRTIYCMNPHLREIFINRENLIKCRKEFTREMRILAKAAEPIALQNNTLGKINTTEHWGQRKLLLTEIEFLTTYGSRKNCLVIYAGAAPGTHLGYLSDLFPDLKFVLYDTKTFDVVQTDRIEIRREAFSDDAAKSYVSSRYPVLFICNVHTFNDNENVLEDMPRDMEYQRHWHNILKPYASLLNFRWSHKARETEYLSGEIIVEPWASRRTNECRLVVTNDNTKMYSNQIIEEALAYFHNVTRIMYYEHNMDDVDNEGLDHCYDCRAEIFILQEYLSKIQAVRDPRELFIQVARMSADISKRIVNKARQEALGWIRTLDIIPKKEIISKNF